LLSADTALQQKIFPVQPQNHRLPSTIEISLKVFRTWQIPKAPHRNNRQKPEDLTVPDPSIIMPTHPVTFYECIKPEISSDKTQKFN
jgi:hypothetical protein